MAVDHVLRQAGRARVCDVVVPFVVGAGRARDRQHDELIDRARQHALELEKEAELLDPARQLRMIEQRHVRPAEVLAPALRRAAIVS